MKQTRDQSAGRTATGANGEDRPIQRDILPIPDRKHVGLTTYDAKDPNTKYPADRTAAPADRARPTCWSS